MMPAFVTLLRSTQKPEIGFGNLSPPEHTAPVGHGSDSPVLGFMYLFDVARSHEDEPCLDS
jgi:hypothetical protein